MKHILLLTALFISLNIFATNQEYDNIEYNGGNYQLGEIRELSHMSSAKIWIGWTFPLEQYFKQNDMPYNFLQKYSMTFCSNNDRAYAAQWQIKENRLYLIHLKSPNSQISTDPDTYLKLTYVNKDWKSPVFAQWYTGEIVLGTPFPAKIGVYKLTIKNGVVEKTTPMESWLESAIPDMTKIQQEIYRLNRDKSEKESAFFLISSYKLARFMEALDKLHEDMRSEKVKELLGSTTIGIPMFEYVDPPENAVDADKSRRIVGYYLFKQNEKFINMKTISIKFIFKLKNKAGKDVDSLEKMIFEMN